MAGYPPADEFFELLVDSSYFLVYLGRDWRASRSFARCPVQSVAPFRAALFFYKKIIDYLKKCFFNPDAPGLRLPAQQRPPPITAARGFGDGRIKKMVTLEEAQAQLMMWIEAERAVASSQSYTIGSRSLTRANLTEIGKRIDFWRNEIAAIKAGNKSGAKRVVRAVPRDL